MDEQQFTGFVKVREALVVFTGISGSGKSSLAFIREALDAADFRLRSCFFNDGHELPEELAKEIAAGLNAADKLIDVINFSIS